MVKNLPATQENRYEPWVGKISWRREWQPTPVFLPGESHGQRSLVDYSPWGHKESDTTERLTFSHSLSGLATAIINELAKIGFLLLYGQKSFTL